jgi:hypothetical protein
MTVGDGVIPLPTRGPRIRVNTRHTEGITVAL